MYEFLALEVDHSIMLIRMNIHSMAALYWYSRYLLEIFRLNWSCSTSELLEYILLLVVYDFCILGHCRRTLRTFNCLNHLVTCQYTTMSCNNTSRHYAVMFLDTF